MSRYHAQVDANQAEVVAQLRQIGASVQSIATVGGGCPDLLVGYRGRTYTFEVKSGKAKLNDKEREWHRDWRGQVTTIYNAQEAMIVIGAVREVEKM